MPASSFIHSAKYLPCLSETALSYSRNIEQSSLLPVLAFGPVFADPAHSSPPRSLYNRPHPICSLLFSSEYPIGLLVSVICPPSLLKSLGTHWPSLLVHCCAASPCDLVGSSVCMACFHTQCWELITCVDVCFQMTFPVRWAGWGIRHCPMWPSGPPFPEGLLELNHFSHV